MIVDCRTYTLRVGTQSSFVQLYERYGRAAQRRILGEPIGWYATEVGVLNQIVHLWGYSSLEDRARRRAALIRDPHWQGYLQRAAALDAIARQENQILTPALAAASSEAARTAGEAS